MNPTDTPSPSEEQGTQPGKPDGIRFEEYAPPTPTVEEFKRAIVRHLRADLLHGRATATPRDWWTATCLASRDWAVIRFARTQRQLRAENPRRVYYLSLEYLMGRLMVNNLISTNLYKVAEYALAELGQDIHHIEERESDMGLGNGGLGRLAACFLDSLATLEYPAVGYGILYEFGLFKQQFVDGRQMEKPDAWMRYGSPFAVVRPEFSTQVHLYGHVEPASHGEGDLPRVWKPSRTIVGVPWDIPIIGYGCETVNFLRLWESRASLDFDFATFDRGGYMDAVRDKVESETISKVLYPNDNTESGKELRLVQQYFFVACSLRDLLRRHFKAGNNWDSLPEKAVIQLNDTHPAVAILELMRLLVDESKVPWIQAWDITRKTFAYTNHTLLPEALESWSADLLHKVLPRHLQIAEEINRRFLEETVLVRWPGDVEKMRVLSLFEENHPKSLRMAHLSVLGSFSTNGVAAMHTRLIKSNLFPEFNELYPERFNNKTNGITPRRWLLACNPELASLITGQIGDGWVRDLDQLRGLESVADDPAFQKAFMAVKLRNKERLGNTVKSLCGFTPNAEALFDVQIKRLHEYKRQHLNLLHILTLYRRLLADPELDICPRVFLFSAKAAPGYFLAKEIIYAINLVAKKINHDERIADRLKVAFLPNYGVSLAEKIIPAADLSEQISTAGKEASGTGNMKLALNGALTIGTLDGANVEILQEVGEDNIFIFGMTVEEVDGLHASGYSPRSYYEANAELRGVLDWLRSGEFGSHGTGGQAVAGSLLDGGDPFLVLADYKAYVECQERVDLVYRDQSAWARKAILNTARVGYFSSDRTIRQYAEEVWKIKPCRLPTP
ncbi:MAG: glycogen/starch/alpha-glucan phosphorylase [Verrucomicrobiae bacterium]|nr:glycogen/starch/alpha-glucan phosphorylase [Verrucomicrobiae bacterium]